MAYRRKTAEEIRKAVNDLSTEAKRKVEEYAKTSEGLGEYLDFMSKFYNYSPRNNALIKSSFEGALAVKGFRQWKQEGFPVQKGERAIEILIPNIVRYYKDKEGTLVPVSKADPETRQRIKQKEISLTSKVEGFTKGHVFDITQTMAEEKDYPKYYPNRREEFAFEGENLQAFTQSLKQYAEKTVTSLTFEPISTVAKGYYEVNSHKIVLNNRLSETETAKTLIHELAHAKLHHDSSPHVTDSRREKEMQAEMTAYVVAKSFGLDPSDSSIDYIANWTEKFSQIDNVEQNLAVVQKTSREMIKEINDLYGLELEKTKENVQEKGSLKEGKPMPEKAVEITQEAEEREVPHKPYVLIQNFQPLTENSTVEVEKGGLYTVEEMDQIFEEHKATPFKVRYQLFEGNASEPISNKKLTKTVSNSYKGGTFTQSAYEQIEQLKNKGVQHTVQRVNERELE